MTMRSACDIGCVGGAVPSESVMANRERGIDPHAMAPSRARCLRRSGAHGAASRADPTAPARSSQPHPVGPGDIIQVTSMPAEKTGRFYRGDFSARHDEQPSRR
jgi:hypothetical protein